MRTKMIPAVIAVENKAQKKSALRTTDSSILANWTLVRLMARFLLFASGSRPAVSGYVSVRRLPATRLFRLESLQCLVIGLLRQRRVADLTRERRGVLQEEAYERGHFRA